ERVRTCSGPRSRAREGCASRRPCDARAVVAGPCSCACRAVRRVAGLPAFRNLVDVVRDEAVRLAVNGMRSLRAGGFDEAKDLARPLVYPVALVVDTVLRLLL